MTDNATRPGYLPEFSAKDEQDPDVDAQTAQRSAADPTTREPDCEPPGDLPVYEVSDDHIPEDFRDMSDVRMWVLWNGVVKVPLAPWETGNLRVAPWGEEETRCIAETTLDKAERFAKEEMAVTLGATQLEMHDSEKEDPYEDVEFALANDPRVDLKPAPLLLHEDPDHEDRLSTLRPPIMLVDLDSVRCPECGTVCKEAHRIVKELNAYTEVSTSGTGLHIWIRGSLPEGVGMYIKEIGDHHPCLNEAAEIELYDHGRFNGATWRHVADTPQDRVPERQETMETLIDRYATEEDAEDIAEQALNTTPTDTSTEESQSGDADRSKYYELELDPVLDRCKYPYRHYARSQRDWLNGPHPVHGPNKSNIDECTNFGTKDGYSWNCFAHGNPGSRKGKGGALALIALNEEWLECEKAYRTYDDPEILAATCIAARDKYGFSPEDDDGNPAAPPVKALYGLLCVAGRDDVESPERLMYAEGTGTTDQLAREVAEQMWEEITLSQFIELAEL